MSITKYCDFCNHTTKDIVCTETYWKEWRQVRTKNNIYETLRTIETCVSEIRADMEKQVISSIIEIND